MKELPVRSVPKALDFLFTQRVWEGESVCLGTQKKVRLIQSKLRDQLNPFLLGLFQKPTFRLQKLTKPYIWTFLATCQHKTEKTWQKREEGKNLSISDKSFLNRPFWQKAKEGRSDKPSSLGQFQLTRGWNPRAPPVLACRSTGKMKASQSGGTQNMRKGKLVHC